MVFDNKNVVFVSVLKYYFLSVLKRKIVATKNQSIPSVQRMQLLCKKQIQIANEVIKLIIQREEIGLTVESESSSVTILY